MSIDFSTLQGLTIPEGVVTQITDASGRVLWSAVKLIEDRAVLTVAKQTATTYAGETEYADESFVLFDIYPLSGGTVNITFDGVTKTIKDDGTSEKPNAQQVFFGTFNGVSDGTTATSGTLTIEGNFYAYGVGPYSQGANKLANAYGSYVTAIIEFGEYVTDIPENAFKGCTSLTSVTIPNSVTTIGDSAFYGCTSLTSVTIPNSVTTIGDSAFYRCTSLTSVTIPNSVTTIGDSAFYRCTSLTSVTIPNSVTTISEDAFYDCRALRSVTIPDSVTSIEANAFSAPAGVLNQQTITILSATPATINSKVFGMAGADFKIVVPTGCGDTYKAADGWSDYADYIVEAS